MIAYSSEELIPVTDLSKKFISYLAQLQAQTVDKIAILHNNHIEAVVISKEKYENMQEAIDLQHNQRVTNDLLLEFQELSKNISKVDKNIDISFVPMLCVGMHIETDYADCMHSHKIVGTKKI